MSRLDNDIKTRSVVPVIIVLFLSLVAVFTVIGFASTTPSDDHSSSVSETSLGVPMVQFAGEWTADVNGIQFGATVKNNLIAITMSNDTTSMLYWNGTFEDQGSIGNTIVSEKQEAETVMMSRATSKDFVVGDGELSFEFKAMGTTTIVTLKHA